MNSDDPSAQELLERVYLAPSLTETENRALFQRMWDGDPDAREQLIDGNMHWVLRVIERFVDRPRDAGRELKASQLELVTAARQALAKAVDKYSEFKFVFAPDESLSLGYAHWWVRLALTKLEHPRGIKQDRDQTSEEVLP